MANIRATSLFENGLFTTNTFYLTGNQFNATSPVAYDSSLCPAAAPAATLGCDLPKPVGARLGSNVGFPVNSVSALQAMVDQWKGFAVYGQATVEDARELCGNNTKCHTLTRPDGTPGNVVAVPERLSIAMPQPAITGPCPNGGRLGSGVKPPMQVLPVGDYRCSRLIIQGTLTVSGDANRDVRIHVDNELSIVPAKNNVATVINRQVRPSRFQLYLPEREGSANVSQICGSESWALLYTPGLDIDCHGSAQTTIYGAVVARSYSGTGNHFSFHWDASSRNAVNNGKYRVYNWRGCPVGTVDC